MRNFWLERKREREDMAYFRRNLTTRLRMPEGYFDDRSDLEALKLKVLSENPTGLMVRAPDRREQ